MKGEKPTFGEFVKERRIELGITLRIFADEAGVDPGNWSKLERGRLPAPQSREKLEEYARHLRLKKGTDAWYQFFDLAAAESGRIPEELLEDNELVAKLPALFRTLRGQKVSREELDALVKKLRQR